MWWFGGLGYSRRRVGEWEIAPLSDQLSSDFTYSAVVFVFAMSSLHSRSLPQRFCLLCDPGHLEYAVANWLMRLEKRIDGAEKRHAPREQLLASARRAPAQSASKRCDTFPPAASRHFHACSV